MPGVINLAAYKFVTLDRLPDRRGELRELCLQLELKGTILLSPEGINLFVAGCREAVDTLLARLRSDPALADLAGKESESDQQPFNRMLVRLKQEIIPCGVDGIDPREKTSPKLSAAELKRWLDEGKPVTLLDVRNDYEVDLGTFHEAQRIGIAHFRHFPEAVKNLPSDMKQRPVVMFCTGGIRCEKAGPLMEQSGFDEVYQLDGGILKYFEEVGGDHYDGDCFVFDKRVALNSQLAETGVALCYACLSPVPESDQQSPRYVPGNSCPRCYVSPHQAACEQLALRNAAVRQLIDPLPGSQAYVNLRPMNVPAKFDRFTLLELLAGLHPHVGRDKWIERCRQGRIRYRGDPISADRVMRAGERIEHLIPATIEPPVNAALEILHEDDSIVVVDKPAPLPTHPSGRFNRNTLLYLIDQIYAPFGLRVVHRLDANTTGLVLLAKTRKIAHTLQAQFKENTVAKTYLARVQGHPALDSFVLNAPISREPGRLGIRTIDPDGLAAVTEVRVNQRRPDGSTQIEVVPKNGRTNQIRVHLWSQGLPICGDRAYLPEKKLGNQQTLTPGDDPLCLHAWKLQFRHPQTGGLVEFQAAAPDWYVCETS